MTFLRDIFLAAILLIALVWMTGCASIHKNVYFLTDGDVDITYTTRSATDVKAEDLADHAARLGAIKEGLEFFGPGKQSRTVSGGGKIEIKLKLPDWGRVIDLTPDKSST